MRIKPKKSRFVKGLTIVFTVTLISSFGLAVWSNMTSGYSTVLEYDDIALIQLDAPKTGDPFAVMHTTAGDMTYILYPEQCPQTVSNFTKLAEQGYYDGTYVFRVEPDVFFSAGAKTPEDEAAAESNSEAQEHIPQELSAKLWPLRGALCALTTSAEGGFWKTITKTRAYYTGSRFLVCNSIEMTDEIREGLCSGDNDAMLKVGEAFVEKGGIPNYSQQITVFGQLYEGFEILDAVTGAELTGEGENRRPKDDIRIESIEITKAQ
ncbi:MAG: peptidylprolyl isomerase [Oscillospiraceae bacterium]|nr:peptidylprolyl isomerase [Oscillospiraceae bacterium]